MGMFDQLKDMNKMREHAKHMQGLLAQEDIMGQSKDAMVRLVMDGNQTVKSVEILDEIVGDRKRIAQDVREALGDMLENYKKIVSKKFGNMMQ